MPHNVNWRMAGDTLVVEIDMGKEALGARSLPNMKGGRVVATTSGTVAVGLGTDAFLALTLITLPPRQPITRSFQ